MIEKIFDKLLQFVKKNRQTGHTALLNKIAKKEDIYIIIHDNTMKQFFDKDVQHKLISMNNLNVLRDANNKPVLIDNAAFKVMLEDSLYRITKLNQESAERHEHMRQIDKILIHYKKTFVKDHQENKRIIDYPSYVDYK